MSYPPPPPPLSSNFDPLVISRCNVPKRLCFAQNQGKKHYLNNWSYSSNNVVVVPSSGPPVKAHQQGYSVMLEGTHDDDGVLRAFSGG